MSAPDPHLAPVDWSSWQPRERAVLCFIRHEGQVLLIHKLRGLGAGKVNAPGGKIEPGETPLEAAVRETEEETGVTPLQPRARGELRFQFTSGYSLHCTMFLAHGCVGTLRETSEAIPFWQTIETIPYAQMWEDDQYWLPALLQGEQINASFTFADDRMLTKEIECVAPTSPQSNSITSQGG